MGATALACHGAGGRVHGVIPAALASCERKATNTPADLPSALREPVPAGSANESDRSVVSVVSDMHERKMLMSNHGSGFIVLPGGFGTLEECMVRLPRRSTALIRRRKSARAAALRAPLTREVTWTQLSWHRKPTIVLDVAGACASSSRLRRQRQLACASNLM